MKKVKAIKRYSDVVLKKIVEKDHEFEVSDDRAKHLVEQGMVTILGDAKEKKETAEQKGGDPHISELSVKQQISTRYKPGVIFMQWPGAYAMGWGGKVKHEK